MKKDTTITTKYLEENGWVKFENGVYKKDGFTCEYTEFDEDWQVSKIFDNKLELERFMQLIKGK